MPHKPKKAEKKRDRYAEFAARWEQRRKEPDRGGGEWMVDRPKLPVAPRPFLQTLRQLGYIMPDRRFIELHADLVARGPIDFEADTWVFADTKITRVLPELIEEAIAAGFSEREAIAEAVVVFELYPDAQSFDAAWKRLERLLHKWRKAVGQKPA
jgi:hypothetical protein